MGVDSWDEILLELDSGPGVIVADMDMMWLKTGMRKLSGS